jgi:hypothetical protein
VELVEQRRGRVELRRGGGHGGSGAVCVSGRRRRRG